ncbi:ribonuclease E activity regulator RraA [Variovorax sp. PvP013]|jgi:regulator of ribonuclease activity A|uniref:ribonuclease E activity regulator RraA n=1 Tax=Variovorax sp. PvP013 TaxID=3156435 RepID=UPI003D244821
MTTADLCDRAGAAARVCPGPWRLYGGRRSVAGAIATVRTFKDAQPIRLRLAQPGEGRILVVDAGGSLDVAVLGDRMATLGLANGWAGVLVHGVVRDAEALRRLDFAVFALGTSPARATELFAEAQGRMLTIQNVMFTPGDFVAMDADGVVVVTTGMAQDTEMSGTE